MRKKLHFLWHHLPIIGSLFSSYSSQYKEQAIPCRHHMEIAQAHPELLPYPIDMFPWLDMPFDNLNEETNLLYKTVLNEIPMAHHPTYIAQYGLARWNAYLKNGENKHKEAFMTSALWFMAHELRLSSETSGWPISSPLQEYYAPELWLSALTQGNVISVLVRAYQLTGKDAFLEVARRAVRTFELDILDGGVNSPLLDNGIYFEEVAVYPAAHILSGHIFALFGLYDYRTITKDYSIETIVENSINTLHALLDAFDTGYWTRHDLLHKRLASWFYHSLHVTLLEALASHTGCDHCKALAAHWAGYQQSFGCRLRHLIMSRVHGYSIDKLKRWVHRLVFRAEWAYNQLLPDRICVPITKFPISGGMRSVLAGVSNAMADRWQITYLTHQKGQDAEGLEILTFGRRIASPWRFPGVWLYCLAGGYKLYILLRKGFHYDLILPQDGVFTAAFAALLGKMAGMRVICMDHGSVTLSENPLLGKAWMNGFSQPSLWPLRILSRLLTGLYLPSLRILSRIATHYTDLFLIAGDEVEDAYRKKLGVHPSRIIRYAYEIDIHRFAPRESKEKARMRREQDIPESSILITLINRLVPEKGLHFALEGIAVAVSKLPPDIQTRVKVLIAGDGPLRSQIEMDIRRYGIDSVCTLWGDATPADVITLLSISDIFLYSGTRGTNYSMAVLEAMAASCAVIASTTPQSNARLLAEGRGIAIRPSDASEIGDALVRLCSNLELCSQMGDMAREYVATYHNAHMLKRTLLRASFFAPKIVLEDSEARYETEA